MNQNQNYLPDIEPNRYIDDPPEFDDWLKNPQVGPESTGILPQVEATTTFEDTAGYRLRLGERALKGVVALAAIGAVTAGGIMLAETGRSAGPAHEQDDAPGVSQLQTVTPSARPISPERTAVAPTITVPAKPKKTQPPSHAVAPTKTVEAPESVTPATESPKTTEAAAPTAAANVNPVKPSSVSHPQSTRKVEQPAPSTAESPADN